MTAPIKFDFSDYTPAFLAIPAIPNSDAPTANTAIAEENYDLLDDRRFCRECLNIRNGFCAKQRFRPVDDIPRRCDDFMGLSDVAGMAS
jgi:hypothetical protein